MLNDEANETQAAVDWTKAEREPSAFVMCDAMNKDPATVVWVDPPRTDGLRCVYYASPPYSMSLQVDWFRADGVAVNAEWGQTIRPKPSPTAASGERDELGDAIDRELREFRAARLAAQPKNEEAAECECATWATDRLRELMLGNGHNPRCPKFVSGEGARPLVAKLVKGIREWAADEDGVPEHLWPAYVDAVYAIEGKMLGTDQGYGSDAAPALAASGGDTQQPYDAETWPKGATLVRTFDDGDGWYAVAYMSKVGVGIVHEADEDDGAMRGRHITFEQLMTEVWQFSTDGGATWRPAHR